MSGADPAVVGVCIGASFVLGAIPCGYLIGRAKGIDIREHGSKNIGATNVGRVLGRRLGLLCFGLDAAKGAAATLGTGAALGVLGVGAAPPAALAWAWLGAMVAVIAGHMFTPFLGFKGGKGVATGLGAMLGLFPHLTFPGLLGLGAWFVVLRVTGYVSASSCVAALLIPACLAGIAVLRGADPFPWPFFITTAALGAIVVWKHRANLARLRAGTEPRVSWFGRRGGAR